MGIHAQQGTALFVGACCSALEWPSTHTSLRAQACDGGLAEGAFDYIKDAGGIRLESDVPYRGASPDTCTLRRLMPTFG